MIAIDKMFEIHYIDVFNKRQAENLKKPAGTEKKPLFPSP